MARDSAGGTKQAVPSYSKKQCEKYMHLLQKSKSKLCCNSNVWLLHKREPILNGHFLMNIKKYFFLSPWGGHNPNGLCTLGLREQLSLNPNERSFYRLLQAFIWSSPLIVTLTLLPYHKRCKMAHTGMDPWVQCGAWPLEPSNLPRVCWAVVGQALPSTAALCACPMSTPPSITCQYQPRSERHQNTQNDSLERIFSWAIAESWAGMSLNPSLLFLMDSPRGNPLLCSKSPHRPGPAPARGASPQIKMTTQKSECLVAASLTDVFNKKGGFSILRRDVCSVPAPDLLLQVTPFSP